MSTPTPIGVVRAYIPKIEYTRTFYGREREEVLTALNAVLADAERFKALERAHDKRADFAWCKIGADSEPGFFFWARENKPLSELADRLKNGGAK